MKVFSHKTNILPVAGLAIVLAACGGEFDEEMNQEAQPDLAAAELSSEALEGEETNEDNALSDEVDEPLASTKQSIVVIGAAVAACAGTHWYKSSRINASDAVQHCAATCGTMRYCGIGVAYSAAVGKEIFDAMCKYAPSYIKRAVNSISQCGGWSNADIRADAKGAGCATKFWKGCRSCCGG